MQLCNHPACKKPRARAGVNEYGVFYRKKCFPHYREELLKKRGYDSYSEYQTSLVKNLGFNSITEYKNSIHPYLRHRKNFCENVDGRLGFVCTTTIQWSGMLDVDHKDGNHLNNNLRNLQTLCKCCHSYKTNLFEDYKTPGRKTRVAA